MGRICHHEHGANRESAIEIFSDNSCCTACASRHAAVDLNSELPSRSSFYGGATAATSRGGYPPAIGVTYVEMVNCRHFLSTDNEKRNARASNQNGDCAPSLN